MEPIETAKTMDIKEVLAQLPEKSGIYLMKNKTGTIIYVGKAKNLKKRVSQYFQKNRSNSPKVEEMILHINRFETIITDTELEAFLLENKTIKELKPKYNRLLVNHRGYKYIRITLKESFPRILMAVQMKNDGSRYFGPFTSQGSVENTIGFLRDYYGIRNCGSRSSVSGCLNLHLGSCLGPCTGNISVDAYQKKIEEAIRFLDGFNPAPLKELHDRMRASAEDLDFESAARYRDQIRGIRHVMNKQKLIKVSKSGRQLLAAERCGADFKLFFIKGNRLLHIERVSQEEARKPGFEDGLKVKALEYFKAKTGQKEENLSQEDIDEAQIIYSYLKKKCNAIRWVKIPVSRIETLDYAGIRDALFR